MSEKSEYIRKSDAVEELNIPVTMSMCVSEEECAGLRRGVQLSQRLIEEMTAIDAVEVVRCKDCAFCYYDSSIDERFCAKLRARWDVEFELRVSEDGFCCWGINRERV